MGADQSYIRVDSFTSLEAKDCNKVNNEVFSLSIELKIFDKISNEPITCNSNISWQFVNEESKTINVKDEVEFLDDFGNIRHSLGCLNEGAIYFGEGAGKVDIKIEKEGYEEFSVTLTDTDIKNCGLTPRAIEIFMQPTD